MCFAFSRDGAVPGHTLWRRLNHHRTPTWSVLLVVVLALVITIPALFGNSAGLPVAFYAVTSIAVLGLYLSFAIPIWLRYRHGDKFDVGEWNNGAKYKWMNPLAVAEIIIVSIYLMLPNLARGNPFDSDFSWKFVNYSPIVLLGVLLAITIWWQVSAKNWFKGPIRTIESAEVP